MIDMTALQVVPLTDRGSQILELIRSCVKSRGYPPTVREIGKSLGLSISTVHYHLRRLDNDGWIKLPQGRSRAITLAEAA